MRIAEALAAGAVVAAVLVAIVLWGHLDIVLIPGVGFLVAFAALVATGRTKAGYGRYKLGARVRGRIRR